MLRILSKIPFVVMTLLALFLFTTTMIYWSFRPDVNFLLSKQDLVEYMPWRVMFYLHVAGGMLSIGAGPFQFIGHLRKKSPRLHRNLGKIYAASILLLGAPTGLYMAFYANGGWPASVGFVLMAVLWFHTTFMGIKTIRNGNVTAHRQWMMRSYALTFSAVTLRLWVPLLSLYSDLSALSVVISTAWISWLFNLLFIELFLKIKTTKILKHENVIA